MMPDRINQHRISVDWWTFAAVLLALAAVTFQFLMPTKDDISWLITNAEALLDGKELYKDIIETNPPLSILLYVPAVVIARLTGLRAEGVSIVFTASVGLAIARMARQRLDKDGTNGGGPIEVAISLVFLVLPLGAYGQKDHVAALVAIPYFIELMLLSERQARTSVAAGVLAGLCVAVKPHFVLAVAFPCLWLTAMSWRKERNLLRLPVLSRANVAAATVAIVFQGLVYLLFPAFFRDVLPIVLEIYVPAREPLWSLLIEFKGWLFLAFLLLAAAVGPRTVRLSVLLLAGLGFFCAYLLQAKGWPYHLFPAMSYGLLAFFWLVIPHVWGRGPHLSAPIVVTIGILLSINHSLWMMVSWIDWTPLTRAIMATGISRPKVLNIAGSHEIGHPSVRDAGGQWVGTLSCRWIALLAINRAADGARETDRDALAAWIAYDRQVLRSDIAERHPDLILVDRRGTFDWLAWAREDPETAHLLEGYRPAGEVTDGGDAGSIELLKRSQENGHDADAGTQG